MLLYQPESGYCYNSDSLFLYDFISSFQPKGRVLDIGAGCGIVGLLVARDNPKVQLEAVEKQEVYTQYAITNAKVNTIEYKLYSCDFLELDELNKYDYIVSNPPFYHEGSIKSQEETRRNARYSDNLPLNQFFKKVSRLLKPNSHFMFCYDATQFSDICVELSRVNLRVVDVMFVHSKLQKPSSLVLIHTRNGSKSMMKILPPLITMDGEGYTPRVQAIYEKSKTWSIKCQI